MEGSLSTESIVMSWRLRSLALFSAWQEAWWGSIVIATTKWKSNKPLYKSSDLLCSGYDFIDTRTSIVCEKHAPIHIVFMSHRIFPQLTFFDNDEDDEDDKLPLSSSTDECVLSSASIASLMLRVIEGSIPQTPIRVSSASLRSFLLVGNRVYVMYTELTATVRDTCIEFQ